MLSNFHEFEHRPNDILAVTIALSSVRMSVKTNTEQLKKIASIALTSSPTIGSNVHSGVGASGLQKG